MLLELKMIMAEGMPKYAYKCSACGEQFEVFHLMSEVLENCEKCGAECSLKKVISYPINVQKNEKKQKVGEVVKQHIEEARQDIKKEKKKMKEKEYKP